MTEQFAARAMTSELVALASVEAAERAARSLIAGIRECAECGHPLNELQQIALLKLALLEYDGHEASLRSTVEFTSLLHAEARRGPPGDHPKGSSRPA